MQSHGIKIQEIEDIRSQLTKTEAQVDFLQKMRKSVLDKQLALAPDEVI